MERSCDSSPSLNIQVQFLTCACFCVCALEGMLGYGLKVSLCKYAEHGGPRTGAEGEHGVAELIYLMTERLISPQP